MSYRLCDFAQLLRHLPVSYMIPFAFNKLFFFRLSGKIPDREFFPYGEYCESYNNSDLKNPMLYYLTELQEA